MSYPVIQPKGITGLEALRRQLFRLGYTKDDEIWIKVANNRIHVAQLTDTGLGVWECWSEKDSKGEKIADPKGGSVWRKGRYYADGYKYLASRAGRGEEMFIVVNFPQGGIGNGHCSKFQNIFFECDLDSIESQWQKLNWAANEFGLVPSTVVFSGSKSLHVYFRLDREVEPEVWKNLQRKAIAVFCSDATIQNYSREMRLAGFDRTKKGSHQRLDFESDTVYSPEDLEGILDKACGFTSEGLSKSRWEDIFKVLRNRELPREQKESKVREIAGLPEDSLPAVVARRQVEQRRTERAIQTFNGRSLIDAVEEASEKLGADAFSWSGHDWKWDGVKKARGNCPWHRSNSGTSGWITLRKNGSGWGYACLNCFDNKQIGAFAYWLQLKNGLGSPYPTGRQWIEAARGFCAEAGVVVPESSSQEWNKSADFYSKRAEQLEAFEKNQQIIEQAQNGFDRLKKLISRAIATPIQYVAPKVKRRVKLPKTITYVPGSLPSPEEYKALGEPKIHFDPSQRVQVWQEAVAKGWKDILDNSHPGLGKSYIAGELIPNEFGVDKLVYQDINHRNPSVVTVEDNFVDLPVRNNGFKIDTTRQTAAGQNYKVWTKPGETPDTDGNCHRTYLFNAFRTKNFSALEFEDSSESPICAGCSLSQQCKFSAGPGYGFRMQKRKVIQDSDRLRAHPDSTPSVLFGKGEKVFTVGRIWEEAGQLLDSVKSVEVTLEDFNETLGHLALELPEEFEKLRPVFEALRSFLSQELKPDNRYGFDDGNIRTKLPAYPQDLDIAGIKAALSPDLEFLAEKDGIVSNKTERTNALRYAARELEKQGAREAGREFLGLRLYWLPDFLEAWSGGGSLRCTWGKLNIYTRNVKHKELADSAHFNIYLDATLAPSLLKMKLGVDGPVLLLEQQTPSYANLKIIHVTGLGQLGKDRSASCTERVNALKVELSERHSDLGILDWKAIAKRCCEAQIASKSERPEYGHFVDGRGVNRFEGNSAIAAFGVPYSNVGTLASEYQVMTGRTVNLDQEDGEFQEYVTELVNSEVIQEIGRLRAHRRPNEPLTFYFCGDYDTEFLKESFPGATVQQVDAFTITPDAGSANQQTRWGILQAVKQLVESGQKVTQQAIAKIGEISQPLVSKVSSQMGGWGTLKKLLLTLLSSLYRGSNNFSERLEPEQQGLVDSYLPLLSDSSQVSGAEAAEALGEIVEAYGETVFEQMVLTTPRQVRLQLISQILLAATDVVLPTTLEFDYFAQIAAIAS